MKKFYVEYNNEHGRNVWCVVHADRIEDVEYTFKMYGLKVLRAEEIR